MPNHWHLVLWPVGDDDLSEYMHWVTMTHTQRWHAFHETVGTGPIYQGRFKSFPVQEDDHFYTVCRYVERNALRGNLVTRAEMWRWSSLWQRQHMTGTVSLADWPLPCSGYWLQYVNQPETESELLALRQSTLRGVPFGDNAWNQQTAERLGIELLLKRPGRPRKVPQ
jgi:putative transposase